MFFSFAVALATIPNHADDLYVGNRAPLAPSPFRKLPTGSVRAKGWLLKQLELQRDGYSGRLAEISKFLDPKDNAWMGNATSTRAGWEELPYWLKGQISLAYVLDDPKLKDECKPWIESILKGQRADGWLGPETNLNTRHGTPDLWPNCLVQNALQTYYEATGDARVLTAMKKYVDWLTAQPDTNLFDPKHYWHYWRVGDQINSLVWLYNHTGYEPILKLADRLHVASARWDEKIVNRHGVNFAQGFREPATYAIFSKKESHKQATNARLKEFMDEYGLPGGMYAADENARPGMDDPRQATESCSTAEMMYSGELLLQYQADAKWGDMVEEIAFNWLPPATTADLKGLRYLTCGNMAVSNAPGHSPGIENGGPMFLYDPRDHRCCQHNVGMAWPYLVEHLWFATEDKGLVAAIYMPSVVTAKVADNVKVTIETDTMYPFHNGLTFKVDPEKNAKFPVKFRVPRWIKTPEFKLNNEKVTPPIENGFAVIDREWKKGDQVYLILGASTTTKVWEKHGGAISVSQGPLTFSLRIGEEMRPFGTAKDWPAFELYATTPWNIGLETEEFYQWNKRDFPDQPWNAETVPMGLEAWGREIPEWDLDLYGLVAPLQQSPALSTEELKKIELIPMGAARLRITAFPITSKTGTKWVKGPVAATPLPATYSHRNWWDTEGALSDKIHPENAGTAEIPRFTWWDHKGTEEWVAYKFPETRTFQRARVWFYDDSAKNGGCRVPASWKLQVKIADKWEDVEATYPVVQDGWSAVTFRPVGGTEIRLVAKLRDGFSSGILEWEIE